MGIYKREDSPYWWYSFTIQGRRVRGCTETSSPEIAQVICRAMRADAEAKCAGKVDGNLANGAVEPLTLSKAAAAKLIGISIKTFNAELGAGNFPSAIQIGRRLKFTRTDIDAYLRARRIDLGDRKEAKTSHIHRTHKDDGNATAFELAIRQHPPNRPRTNF